MYNQITANRRRTWMLMTTFVAIILILGYAYDRTLGYGIGGLTLAILLSFGMTALSYFAGDRIALWTSGARTIEKRDAPQLYRIVENLAITAGVPVPAVYVISDPAINAFATGRDPSRASIAVTTGAVDRLANEELEGVIAHELSHITNYDIRTMMVVVVLVGTIALLADWLAEMEEIGRLMGKALKGAASDTTVAEVRRSVEVLCERFPLYEYLQAHATA